ncbi:MAG: helix-turn-helix domain-containing protein [Neglectibacter timonensis]|uniref:helix-turn-helix domain-containing protein n=1 Tax=Neglectibacter timonensis TaxID=1776382 RepID=UPI003991B8C0
MEVKMLSNSLSKRLVKIRETLKISQDELGTKIGISRFSVSNYESGKRNITERVIKDICREFDVNEEWLRTGEGEMFVELPEGTELGKYIADVIGGEDDFIKNIIISYMKLDEKNQKIIRDFVKSLGCEGKA